MNLENKTRLTPKEIQQLLISKDKEIEQLNNIINTFEEHLERELRTSEENSGLEYKEYILIRSTLKKVLKNFRELKESGNNE